MDKSLLRVGWWVLFTIAVIGIVAFSSGLMGMTRNEARSAQPVLDGTIVTATHDIPAGSKLDEEALVEKKVPKSDVPKDAVSFTSYAVGKKATYGFSKGETINVFRLTPKPGECDYAPCGTKCLTDTSGTKDKSAK